MRSKDLILKWWSCALRYLQTRKPPKEPVARFPIRIGCPGEPAFDRDFTVLLDPPPFIAPPVASMATETRTRPGCAAHLNDASRVSQASRHAGSWHTKRTTTRDAAAVAVPAATAGNRKRGQRHGAKLQPSPPPGPRPKLPPELKPPSAAKASHCAFPARQWTCREAATYPKHNAGSCAKSNSCSMPMIRSRHCYH
ncbi:MAG: hypothetical protein IPP88_22785 [Betaproteobacteria bacterium]|nr:hypothetical protein [Betaproteobacteria bacterium]